jgi:hypothetical protein
MFNLKYRIEMIEAIPGLISPDLPLLDVSPFEALPRGSDRKSDMTENLNKKRGKAIGDRYRDQKMLRAKPLKHIEASTTLPSHGSAMTVAPVSHALQSPAVGFRHDVLATEIRKEEQSIPFNSFSESSQPEVIPGAFPHETETALPQKDDLTEKSDQKIPRKASGRKNQRITDPEATPNAPPNLFKGDQDSTLASIEMLLDSMPENHFDPKDHVDLELNCASDPVTKRIRSATSQEPGPKSGIRCPFVPAATWKKNGFDTHPPPKRSSKTDSHSGSLSMVDNGEPSEFYPTESREEAFIHALVVIDKLADQLLTPGKISKSDRKDIPDTSAKSGSDSTGLPPTQKLFAGHGDRIGFKRSLGSVTGQNGMQEPKNQTQSFLKRASGTIQAHDPQFQAEQLADLINSVLVDQARRHGVDLS